MATIRIEEQNFRYAKSDAEDLKKIAFTTLMFGIPKMTRNGKFKTYSFKHPYTGEFMFGVERIDSNQDLLCLSKEGMSRFVKEI